MNKKACNGCENDFYNGHNRLGIKECWNLKTAKLILRKEVPADQRPPWTQGPRRFPSCYTHRGFIYVGANQTE